MARSWDFQGKLKENGQRVITNIDSTIETTTDKEPAVEVSELNGKVTLDIKIPQPGLSESESVGRIFKVDNEIRGEIFNDYANNTAEGKNSHVAGENNKAAYPNQVVVGKYNKNQNNNIIEVGWGTAEERKNIATLDNEGKLNIESLSVQNDITFNNNTSLQQELKNKIDVKDIDTYLKKAEALIFGSENDFDIIVKDTEKVICSIDFVTKEEATPIFMMTIPIEMDYDGNITFTYYLNDSIISNDTITHYCNKGENIVTLINLLDIPENFSGTLKVKMKTSFFSSDIRIQDAAIKNIQRQMQGNSETYPVDTTVPTATIRTYGIKSALYVQGIGLSDAWNARLTFADTFSTITIKKLDKIIFIPFIDSLMDILEEKGKEFFIFANEEYWNCDLNYWIDNKEFFKNNKITVISSRDNSKQDAIKIQSNNLHLTRWSSRDIPSDNSGVIDLVSIGKFGQQLTSLVIIQSIDIWKDSINGAPYKTVFCMEDADLYDFDRKYFTLDRIPYRFPIRKQFRLKNERSYECGELHSDDIGRVTAADYEKVFDIRQKVGEDTKINYSFGIEDWNEKNVEITGFTNPINNTYQAIMTPIDNNGISYIGDYPYNAKIHNRTNQITPSMKQIFNRYFCYHNYGTIITPRKMNYQDFYVYTNKYDEITLNSEMEYIGEQYDKEEEFANLGGFGREDLKLKGYSISYCDIPINNIREIKNIAIIPNSIKDKELNKNEIEINSKNIHRYIRDMDFFSVVYDKFEEKTLTINWSIVRTVTKGEVTMYCDIPIDKISKIKEIKYKVVSI